MHGQTDERAGRQHLDDAPLEAEQGNRRGEGDQCRGPVEVATETLWPQHVIAEEARQIEDHADHGCGNGGEWRGELEFVVGRFHQRATRKNEQERRQEVNQVTRAAATAPARNT